MFGKLAILSRNRLFLRLTPCVGNSLPTSFTFVREKKTNSKSTTVAYESIDDIRDSSQITFLDRMMRMKPAINDEDSMNDWSGFADDDYDLNLDEPNPKNQLTKKLLEMGRVPYRSAQYAPDWFEERRSTICENRTVPQIRRCLKDWMVKVDRDLMTKYRTEKKLIWSEQTGRKVDKIYVYGPEETISYSHYFMPSRYIITRRVLREMKKVLPAFNPTKIIDFGCGPATAGAAAYEVWDSKVQKYTGIDMSQSMLEAAKIMTSKVIPDCVFWDKSNEVIKRASERNERYNLAFMTYTLSELANDATRRAATQIMFELLEVGGCLVIIEPGNPLGSNMVRTARQFVLDTFNHTSNQGVAPELATSSYPRKIQKTQDQLLEEMNRKVNGGDDEYLDDDQKAAKKSRSEFGSFRMVLPPNKGYQFEQIGASVITPCAHDGLCPLAQGEFCSFSQKVPGGFIRMDAEEKFSYVILQKRPRDPNLKSALPVKQKPGSAAATKKPTPPKKFDPVELLGGEWLVKRSDVQKEEPDNKTEPPQLTPLEVLKRYVGVELEEVEEVTERLVDEVDWEEYAPPLHRNEWGRLLRSPIKGNSLITFDLCMPNGNAQRTLLSRSNLLNVPALYHGLRKTSWGGMLPVLEEDGEMSPLAKVKKSIPRNRKPGAQAQQLQDLRAEDLYKRESEATAGRKVSKTRAQMREERLATRGRRQSMLIRPTKAVLDAMKAESIRDSEEAKEEARAMREQMRRSSGGRQKRSLVKRPSER